MTVAARIAGGLMAFPVTPFAADGGLDRDGFAAHCAHLLDHGPSGLVVAGGAGEFHALTPAEVATLARDARPLTPAPLIVGCGYGAALAVEIARAAEAAGADALLLMPPYLVGCPQAGLEAHVRAVCAATGLDVILYHRANALFAADTVARLADACPTLVGFKDGAGDVALVRALAARLGDRLLLLGGMPTHEIYAEAHAAAGARVYSSSVFSFAPRLALRFHGAFARGDRAACDAMLRDFFLPFARIRDRQPGHAVAILKAALRLLGRPAGPVRPPLADLTAEEHAMLEPLLEHAR